MNRLLLVASVAAVCFAGGHTVDDKQYEKLYFEKIGEKIKEKHKKPAGDLKKEENAAEKKGTKSGEKERGEGGGGKFLIKDLEVNSDSMVYNKETSMAVFKGNVKLESGGVIIHSDILKSKNYRDSADARGNVAAYYKEYDIKINCRRMVYGDKMSSIKAYDDVEAKKFLRGGNTLTMKADVAEFGLADGIITARKVKKRVEVKLKDMVAFSDRVIYNEKKEELTMVGKPVVRKQESLFFSEKIIVDVNSEEMNLKQNIWSRFYYSDFEKAKKEAEIEADKD